MDVTKTNSLHPFFFLIKNNNDNNNEQPLNPLQYGS